MRVRFAEQYNLSSKDIEIYVQNKHLALFLEEVATSISDTTILQKASNFILSDVVYVLENEQGAVLPKVHTFVSLITLFTNGTLTSRATKDILLLSMTTDIDIDPEMYAKEHGMIQQNNADDLRPLLMRIITDNPTVVEEYKAGKESVLQFFLGQIMKETKGSANPKMSLEILKELLK
jgi:aspartyl-tRNA(Asn)/glutamyl-tRNA(Gln) amidotransferase subunit B